MARAAARPSRSKLTAVLAPTLALGMALAVGLVILIGDNAAVTDPDPVEPVASVSLPDDPVSQVAPSPVVSIPTEQLEEALDLIDQQRELEAAEVVVRALSAIVVPPDAERGVEAESVSPSSPATDTQVVAEQSPSPGSSSGSGGVPPEEGTNPQSNDASETAPLPSTEAEVTESTAPASSEAEQTPAQPASPPPTTVSQPTIEELGQVLKVEVEELLAADPQDLTEAAQEANNAATPILEYGQEPSILLPPDE